MTRGERTAGVEDEEQAALIELLGLDPHPEGGYFREVFRATAQVPHPAGGGTRAASTAIYFLLPSGSFSALHHVSSDEVWHHYDGDPLELHTIDEHGHHEVALLGRDLAAGQRPMGIVPAGCWQAARPRGERFSLCGRTVSPGFDFRDFEMPDADEILRRLPAAARPSLEGNVRQLTRG